MALAEEVVELVWRCRRRRQRGDGRRPRSVGRRPNCGGVWIPPLPAAFVVVCCCATRLRGHHHRDPPPPPGRICAVRRDIYTAAETSTARKRSSRPRVHNGALWWPIRATIASSPPRDNEEAETIVARTDGRARGAGAGEVANAADKSALPAESGPGGSLARWTE